MYKICNVEFHHKPHVKNPLCLYHILLSSIMKVYFTYKSSDAILFQNNCSRLPALHVLFNEPFLYVLLKNGSSLT